MNDSLSSVPWMTSHLGNGSRISKGSSFDDPESGDSDSGQLGCR